MSKKRALFMALNLAASLGGYDSESIDEMVDHALNYTEAMETVSIKMDILMFRLLNDGFSEDEVYEMVNNLLPEGMEELTEEQKCVVRKDAKKLIKKRKENLNYE
jgi:hypothetical protein